MRFEKVSAQAFGRLRDRHLELGPGLNVIWGANEAGKSTWHDALYAGLCGMRRAKGRMKKEDEAFAERRRPWDRDDWLVGVRIVLGDGRTVEIHQDLNGRIDCKAVDATLGRDVSAEIIHEGTPDGALWLGLDRRSFVATACVRQADLLRVQEGDTAGHLQTFLQKAAASAGGDATVAAALERIDHFRKNQVGRRVAHSTRPLQQALRREEKAGAALERARAEHREFLSLTVQAAEARAAADAATGALTVARTARARQTAVDLRQRVERARVLSERFSDGPPPDSSPETDLPGAVAAVLRAWSDRPRVDAELTGPDAGQIREEIDRLPEEPAGDTEVHNAVAAAHRAVEDSRRQLELHRGRAGGDGASPSATSRPDRATALAAEVARTRGAARAFTAAGAVSLAVAALLLAADWTGLVLWVVVGTTAAFGAGALLRQRDAAAARHKASTWQQHRMERERAVTAAAEALGTALTERGAGRSSDVQADHAAYVIDCDRRREQLARAASRPRLEQQLHDRLAAELAAGNSRERLALVRASLQETADRCEIPAGDDESRAAGLRTWLDQNDARRHRRETELREWTELQQLLDGTTLDDLEARQRRSTDEEARLVAKIAGLHGVASIEGDLETLAGWPDLREEIARRQEARDTATREADRLDGMVQDRAGRLQPVADAEEERAAAERERERLERLDRILERTRGYLQAAQERVHRDIAPVLAGSLNRWLPAVTAGRYREALVNPESLEVQVRDGDGHWRKATGLSHGTTELIYLLLRVALARHLTTAGESCPLLLDDVTVQCDGERTRQVLEVLHALSRERQVILFSQEEEVLRWAREHLREPADTLVELASPEPDVLTDGSDALRV